MLGQTAIGVGLAQLVHLAGQLGQQLDPDHAVFGRALKELGHVLNDISEDEFVGFGVEPTEFGDAGEQGHQTLHYELRQFRLVVQIGQHIIA